MKGSLNSADSDHEAYNSESPLPSDERRYRKYLKDQLSNSKALIRRHDESYSGGDSDLNDQPLGDLSMLAKSLSAYER